MTIYYGSQTGTAESFARDLEREGEEHGFKVHVKDLEETEGNVPGTLLMNSTRDLSGKNRAVFLMATYGEGEPTDNAVEFVRFLKSCIQGDTDSTSVSLEEKKGDDDMVDSSVLSGLEYAVFGLGNKQYEHFNAMGKFVDLAVGKLGGERIIPLSVGDDDDDLDNVTLANGTSGQIKYFVIAASFAGDSCKITPATMCGGNQISFGDNAVGDGCIMVYLDNEGWAVIGNEGGTVA